MSKSMQSILDNLGFVSQLWRINSNIDRRVLSRTLVLDTYRPEICVTGSTGIISFINKTVEQQLVALMHQ